MDVYKMNYALQRASLIENRVDVINSFLNRGVYFGCPVSVSYPRGRGYGEFRVLGFALFRWGRYNLDEIERALDSVDAIKRALFIMSASGRMFWF